MDSIYLGISVVSPLIGYMGLGWFIRFKGWASEQLLGYFAV